MVFLDLWCLGCWIGSRKDLLKAESSAGGANWLSMLFISTDFSVSQTRFSYVIFFFSHDGTLILFSGGILCTILNGWVALEILFQLKNVRRFGVVHLISPGFNSELVYSEE